MKIPDQLKTRYGAVFNHGLLEPITVDMELTKTGMPAEQVKGNLYVSPDGRVLMWFDQDVSFKWLELLFAHPPQRFQVNGTLEDGRSLAVNEAAVTYINVKMEGAATFSSEQIIHSSGSARNCFILMAFSEAVLRREGAGNNSNLKIKYTLLNALFLGTDYTLTKMGEHRLDRFSVQTAQFKWDLVWLPNFNRKLKEELQNGTISYLPTSTIAAPIPALQQLLAADEEVEALCLLMSLVTDAASTWVVRQLWENEILIEELFAPKGVPTSPDGKSRYDVIGNENPARGLQLFLESAISNYKALRDPLRLQEVIGYLEQARDQNVLQIQLAVTILALEVLSHAWCRRDGLTEEQLSTMNIENKLSRMRKTFRFIEKGFTNDILRRDIRNPLLHSGQIPLLSFPQLASWADDLYHLNLRLLFCLLGYRGKYRDFSKGFVLTDAPAV